MHLVVIAEGDDGLRQVVARVLRGSGFAVTACKRGWDLFLLSDNAVPPSLLITDINHGVNLDGFKLAVAAQCRWPALPVLWMACCPARYQISDGERCDWTRMTPFRPKEFVAAIHEVTMSVQHARNI